MKIKVKGYKEKIDVSAADCAGKKCFWPRPDPGVFTQGQGYRQRSVKVGWLCGTREIHGCPTLDLPNLIEKVGKMDYKRIDRIRQILCEYLIPNECQLCKKDMPYWRPSQMKWVSDGTMSGTIGFCSDKCRKLFLDNMGIK